MAVKTFCQWIFSNSKTSVNICRSTSSPFLKHQMFNICKHLHPDEFPIWLAVNRWDGMHQIKVKVAQPRCRDAELDKLHASYESEDGIFYEHYIGISLIKGQRRSNHPHPRDIWHVQQAATEKYGIQNQRNTFDKMREISLIKSEKYMLENKRNVTESKKYMLYNQRNISFKIRGIHVTESDKCTLTKPEKCYRIRNRVLEKSEKQCHIIRDSGKYMFLPCPIGRVGPPRLALCLSPFPFAVTISHKKYTTINVIISLLYIWISMPVLYLYFNFICICICCDLGASREAWFEYVQDASAACLGFAPNPNPDHTSSAVATTAY